MARKRFVLNLAKLMIAAAWADGRLTNQEINALKDLLYTIPDLSGEDWVTLEIYMDQPVTAGERDRLLRTVVRQIRSRQDKELAVTLLTKLVQADGKVDQSEAELLARIKGDLDRAPTGILALLAGAVRGAVGKRLSNSGTGPNREERLEDFIKNRVYFQLVSKLEKEGSQLQLPDAQIRKLCLAAGLMARVALTDAELSKGEAVAIKNALKEGWGLSDEEARLVKDISASAAVKGLDQVLLARGLFECTDRQERRSFVRCLFKIANATHNTSFEEISTIQNIAKGLKLSHRDFINAKLTIPREDRSGM